MEQKQSRAYEALMRLKSTEKQHETGLATRKFELRVDSENHLVEVKTSHESNAENLLSKLESLERKMTGGDNYLSFYNEKKALEDGVMAALDAIQRQNVKVPLSLLKRLQAKKASIEAARKNFR